MRGMQLVVAGLRDQLDHLTETTARPFASHSRHRNRGAKSTSRSSGPSPSDDSADGWINPSWPQALHSTSTKSPGPRSRVRAAYRGTIGGLRCCLFVLRIVCLKSAVNDSVTACADGPNSKPTCRRSRSRFGYHPTIRRRIFRQVGTSRRPTICQLSALTRRPGTAPWT